MHLVHVVPHRQLSYSRSFTMPDDHGDQPELKVSQLCLSLHARTPASTVLCLFEHRTPPQCVC